MLEAAGLMVFYENMLALNNVSIKCEKHQVVGVFGANSAGKSTLMYTLSGIMEDIKKKEEMSGGERISVLGQIRYLGQDITGIKASLRAKKGVILCPERRRIFTESSVLENLRIGGYLASTDQAKDMLAYNSEIGVDFDPEQAKRWLAEAGYPDGKGFPEVTFLWPDVSFNRVIAEALQSMWKEYLGVKVNLINEEWKVYLSTININPPEIHRAGWGADCIVLDISQWAGSGNIQVMFETYNYFGNNLYIDNLMIGPLTDVSENISPSDVMVFPNPSENVVNVQQEIVQQGRPVNRIATIVIITIWILFAAIAVDFILNYL